MKRGIGSLLIRRSRVFTVSAAVAVMCMSFAGRSAAAVLEEVTDFGEHPDNIKMFLYVPDNVKPNPAVLVGLHWCHGTAQAYYSGNRYQQLADTYGYIVIYPGTYSADNCFDVHSAATLTHDGGSDSKGIISMVKYVIKNHHADSTRVFVTGHSGGGMMTNVMLGSYPEIFNAGSGSATVPFACFAPGNNSWNDSCAKGNITHTPEEWGDLVRAAYPGYTGPRPRVQLWHGSNDDVLFPVNFDEAIEQWTNVLGVGPVPTTTEENTPLDRYVRTRYTDANGTVMVEAIRAVGQPHNCKIDENEVISFFGLDKTDADAGTRFNGTAGRNASLTMTRIGGGAVRFSVKTLPGRIAVDLYSVNGVKIAALGEVFSSTGEVTAQWDRRTGNGLTSGRLIAVVVKVNGSVAGGGTFLTAF